MSRKKQRGGGVGCVSRSLRWRRTPLSERLEQAFYVVVKKNVLYMPPSVNDLVLEKLVSMSPISFSFCNKEKRRRLHAG